MLPPEPCQIVDVFAIDLDTIIKLSIKDYTMIVRSRSETQRSRPVTNENTIHIQHLFHNYWHLICIGV